MKQNATVDQPDETPSYRAAMEELEEILAEIEDDGIDLDELAVKVERAAGLIELCRTKIRDTEIKVKSIIDALEQPKED
ncbi:MAG: exodeoxyribonuclease VII small subunit [Bradymonadaceae bacterium]